MDAILLKKKEESNISDCDLVVFDEIIIPILSLENFLPVFTGSEKGMKIIPLSYLIDNYLFPKKEGEINVRALNFISGSNPELFKKVVFYESDEIEIETVTDLNENKSIKPPLGLMPKKIHDEHIKKERFNEVCGAIARYYDAGLKINVEWIEEYNKLIELI